MTARHLGADLSALVDGDLCDEAAAQARRHLGRCATCRERYDAETALKRRLARLGVAAERHALPGPGPSPQLLTALCEVEAAQAWPDASTLGRADPHSGFRRGLALVGAGSLGVALLGLGALTLQSEPVGPAVRLPGPDLSADLQVPTGLVSDLSPAPRPSSGRSQ